MVLRSFVVALALASLTACPKKTEGGLVLKVTIEAGVRADCLVIDATSNGTRASRSLVTRQAMKNEYFIGISRGDFPASLEWQASAYQGRCADETEWKLSSRSTSKTQAFPTTGVEQFELAIGQPDATLDADRDSWVDTGKGGSDCNDGDAQVNPGARQVCNSSVDTNCNGKLFCEDANCTDEAACTTTATGLTYTTTLAALVAADCSGAITVQSVANGRPAAVASDVTITLVPMNTASAGLEFFSDTTCTTRLSPSTLPLRFGSSQVTFSFRARSPGSLTVTASAPGLGSTALTTIITDRAVSSLAVSPVSVSARAGACSTAIDVTALDDRSMPTNVGATQFPLSVNYLPAGTNTVKTFSDPLCAVEVSPSISAGTSTTRLYLKGTRVTPAGMPIQVEFGSPGLAAPAVLDFVVTSGDPHHLEFATQVLGTRNNECSPVPAELRVFDANSNLTTAGAGGLDVSLVGTPPSGGGTLEFFTSSTCMGTSVGTVQIPAGQSSVSVFVRASGPGTYGVTAASQSVAGASLQVDVSTMDPTALFFPSSGVTLATTAGTCSPVVRLQTREANSSMSPVSPVRAATTVTIAPSAAVGVSFFSDPACAMPLTNSQLVIGAGSSEVSFTFRANRSSSLTLSASATNFVTTSPVQPIRIGPAPTSKLVFDAPPVVSALAGQCSGGLVLRSFDTFDNPTSASGAVTPAATPVVMAPDGVVFSSAPNCTPTSATVTMNDGGVTFYASARRAQQYTITATGFSVQSSDSGTFTVDAGAPTVFVIATGPATPIDAATCTSVTLERRDGVGNPSPGAAQAYAVAVNTAGVLSVHGDSASCMAGTLGPALTFAAGQTRTTFFVRGRLVGTSSVTASAAGVTSATTGNVAVNASATTTLRFAAGSPAVTSAVGGCLQATVERLDTEGNLTGVPSDLGVSSAATGAGSTNGLVLVSGNSCASGTAQTSVALTFTGAANSTTFSYSPRAPGSLTFTVTGTGVTSAVGTTTVGAGNVDHVAFVSPPTGDQQYDGCVPFQLEALDVGGNRVSTAESVTLSTSVMSVGTFFANAMCTGGTMNTVNVPAMGVGSFWFKPLPVALGMVTVQATPSVGASGRASLALNIIAGVEAKLTRNDFPATNTAGDCVNFTVNRLDSGDHPAVGALRTVTVTATGGAATPSGSNEALLHGGMGCSGTGSSGTLNVDIGAGLSSATFSVRLRKVGGITIATASSPLSGPANTTTSVGVGPLASITFSTMPPASLVTNTCSPAITVTGQDGQGNAAPLGTQTLTMTNGSFFSDMGCATSIPSLVAGASTSATFYLQNSAAGAQTLTVGGSPSVMQSWTFTVPPVTNLRFKAPAPTMVTRLACSGPYRFQSTDGTNPANSGVARTITFGGTGLQYFSDAACSTPITTIALGAAASETADFYAVAFGTGSTTLTGDAAPALTQATALVTITGSGALSLVATQANSHLEFRSCVAMTVDRQVAPSTPVTGFATVLNLTKSGTAGATSTTFHLMNDCSDAAVTSATIPSAASTVTLYVQGHSAEPTGATTAATATLTATDAFASGFGSDNEVFTVYPAVRRGSCVMATNTSSVACSIGLNLAPTVGVKERSFFTFSVSMPTGLAGATEQNVTCALNTTTIDCERNGNPTANDAINIEWQLLSFGRGVSVAHVSQTISSATPQTVDITLTSTIARAGTFFLTSYRNTSSGLDWDDFPAFELLGTPYDKVQLRNGFDVQQPMVVNTQVVTWQGLSVESGIVSNSNGASWSATPSTASSPSMALLFTNRIASQPSMNGGSICRYRLRGSLSSGAPQFSRGAGSMGSCVDTNMGETVWYRLGFPASIGAVSSPASSINLTGVASNTWTLSGTVPYHRTWSFLAGQGPGGQSTGETSQGSGNDDLGCAVARITMADVSSNTVITLTRGTTTANARFTPFLVVLAE